MRPKEANYLGLQQDEFISTTPSRGHHEQKQKPQFLKMAVLFSSCLATGCVGFLIGRYSQPTNSMLVSGGSESQGTLVKVFQYNPLYAEAPSIASNKAWFEDFPVGQGFVNISFAYSNVSGLSVFHQLHCIDTIRHGYYNALKMKPFSEPLMPGSMHGHGSPGHLAHCFDYLRQCVECSADTNLEPYDWNLGGVTGWGYERVCRDYGAVRDYAEKNWITSY